MEILLGDIGIVQGQQGTWCVCAGAELPAGIVACSKSAKESAEASEALTVHAPGRGSFLCWRGAFTPLYLATDAQRKEAGL